MVDGETGGAAQNVTSTNDARNDVNEQHQVADEEDDLLPAELVEEYYRASARTKEKLVLEWNDIEYSVAIKNQDKKILNGCSGRAESGHMLAIMGPTGCGKTSLMNVLAARVAGKGSETQKLSGEVLVNGKPRQDTSFRNSSSYVTQDDLMYSHLTVLETLTVASHFYCPITDTSEQKSKLVEGILAALGLYKARNTIIGNQAYRGVSGGERKRVNIATQIITDPAVLFLDEPTSGLDSFQALAVMECIKSLADHGRMIITVIHQPRSSIFNLFDQLLLLSDGNDIFFGEANKAVGFFETAGYPCPESFNPADFFLDVLSRDTRSEEALVQSNERLLKLRKFWRDGNAISAPAAKVVGEAEGNGSGGDSAADDGTQGVLGDGDWGIVGLRVLGSRIRLLSWRSWREITGDYFTIMATYIISLVLALIIGGIYSNMGDDQLSIQNRNGLLFFMGVNMGFNGLFSVLNSFPKEKVIVGRERSAGAYGFLSYFASKFTVELPIKVFPAVIYSHIVYWIVGLNPDRFGEFVGIMLVQILCCVMLGYAISATMPTIEASNAVGPLCMIISILFGGFYINIDSLPTVANYVPWISFQRWFFQAAAINEYRGLTFSCDTSGYACKTTGEAVLESLNFDGHTTTYGVFGLSMCMLGFLSYTLLVMLNTKDTFVHLGFVGATYAKLETTGTLVADAERGDLFLAQGGTAASATTKVSRKEKDEILASASEAGVELTGV